MISLMSIWYIILGIVLTILGVGLMFFLIQGCYPKYTFRLPSYIVGFILFFFLGYQITCMVGAMAIKGSTDEINFSIKSKLPDYWTGTHREITPGESQELMNYVTKEYPLVGLYLGNADFQGYDATQIANAMTDKIDEYMNWYILRRVGWSILFIVIGVFIVIKTMTTASSLSKRRNSSSGSRIRRKDDF